MWIKRNTSTDPHHISFRLSRSCARTLRRRGLGVWGPATATPPGGEARGRWGLNKSLTMTYFHRRSSTIIGAKAFHGPVRDGKAWDHLAMVVKRKGAFEGARAHKPRTPQTNRGKKHNSVGVAIHRVCCSTTLVPRSLWGRRGALSRPHPACKVIGSSRTGH